MADIDKINDAISIASAEYHKRFGMRRCNDFPGIMDAYTNMFERIRGLSEQYLRENVTFDMLNESLGALRYHLQLQEHDAKSGALNNYMRLEHMLN